MNDNERNNFDAENTNSEFKPNTGAEDGTAGNINQSEPEFASNKNEEPDYSRFGVPVNNGSEQQNVSSDAEKNLQNEPEKVEAEPVYSPYSGNTASPNEPYSRYNDSYQQVPQQPVQPTVVNIEKKKKSKGFKGFIVSVVAVVVCVAILLFAYPMINKKNTEKEDTASGDSTQISISETPTVKKTGDALTTEQIAENAKKINVGILLYGGSKSFSASSSNALVGEGSGIIMSEDSSKKYTYILTCAHVISDVKSAGYSMTVQDADGKTYDGILVGFDSKTDVGVIKIAATGLVHAEFGDSSSLSIGQTVYAIGNPGGTEFFGSFTDGIVSSIDRPISSESGYQMKCIQHTAAINSGNSGGALLNAFGQVIGINSSKIVSTGYEGMAFSIPISDAKPIIDDIISNGYVTNRPKLGITYSLASNYQQYAMILKLKNLPSASLIIASINEDSSLAKTEAKVGDLIVAVDGKNMDDSSVLLGKIENGKVGDTLKLTLCRVNDDYSIDTFDVNAKLVEDTGTTTSDEKQTTTQSYWEQYFNNGY